jgi:hypothetical protein
MRRKDMVTINVRAWERRLYWRGGVIVDEEVWHAGRLLPRPPRKVPTTTTDADYCAAHRTRIYADLACQFCGERPAPHIAVPADGSHAA